MSFRGLNLGGGLGKRFVCVDQVGNTVAALFIALDNAARLKIAACWAIH